MDMPPGDEAGVAGQGGAGAPAPRLNRRLIEEVRYIAEISNHMKYGEVDDRKMARDIDRVGRLDHPDYKEDRAYMSEEGLGGIMRSGTPPWPQTLHKLAEYARHFDAEYCTTRLYVAAGYLDEADVLRYARQCPPSPLPLWSGIR